MNIPEGLNDLLPEEVFKRRFLENKISQVFNKWGYQEIITPTFEFYEILAKGAGSIMKKEMIKFFDREGNIIALRPEMTTPIARVTSTKLKGEPKPLRFYYISNVFRYDDLKTGNRKEFNQAGVELIGVNSKEADAEVIALAVECLKNSGLKKFFIDIGHINFFNGVMESIKVKEKRKQEIKKAILNKDFVLLEKILSLEDIKDREKEFILKMPTLRGGEEVLEEAEKMIDNKLSLSALKEIKEIYNLLRDYGLEEYILIDLGIIRNFDYYTGIIFEGYTDYLGFPVCGGGRYDNLCAKFGKDLPSTGFAIGIERLATILEKEDTNSLKLERPDKYLVYYQNNKTYFKKALVVAENLRKKGLIVELEIGKREYEKVLNYARFRGIKYILIIADDQSGKIKRIEVISEKKEIINL
ncbi:MAG: ATP phosphoribosyltransferase regulatory subunit [Atribacteria sp.]|nr:ATP phosphoribosyltransferase regulatory subunit [Candidatus Atribacteria bacterium]MBU1291022.1 ATP phosphoribosyltransferase regulatory subunit [bacterium]MBU1427658.1 ATP phosphoribosyltransferase regulatory subunit [bacterium]MBU4047620.1 ATP phosphoribosyltransferase regulatory subunit [bacterium]